MWWIQSLGNARVCLCIYEILSIFSNSWSFYLEVCKEKGRGGGIIRLFLIKNLMEYCNRKGGMNIYMH